MSRGLVKPVGQVMVQSGKAADEVGARHWTERSEDHP